ncbi:hypothetical protein V6N13_115059 [Hibiscus sabdariffa]
MEKKLIVSNRLPQPAPVVGRRLPAQPSVADHPLKLLQPPNRTRSKRKKENDQLFSSVSNNQEHVCSSRHCCGQRVIVQEKNKDRIVENLVTIQASTYQNLDIILHKIFDKTILTVCKESFCKVS